MTTVDIQALVGALKASIMPEIEGLIDQKLTTNPSLNHAVQMGNGDRNSSRKDEGPNSQDNPSDGSIMGEFKTIIF